MLRENRNRDARVERLRLGEMQHQRGRVRRLGGRQVGYPLGILADLLGLDHIEAELGVSRGERLPVVPLGRPQLVGDALSVGAVGPRGGQSRLGFELQVVVDEVVVDKLQHLDRLGAVGGERVHGVRLDRPADPDRIRFGTRRHRGAGVKHSSGTGGSERKQPRPLQELTTVGIGRHSGGLPSATPGQRPDCIQSMNSML